MKLTPVRQGDSIVVAVEGGFKRERAPHHGFQIDVGDTVGFIARNTVALALADLALMLEKPRPRRINWRKR